MDHHDCHALLVSAVERVASDSLVKMDSAICALSLLATCWSQESIRFIKVLDDE